MFIDFSAFQLTDLPPMEHKISQQQLILDSVQMPWDVRKKAVLLVQRIEDGRINDPPTYTTMMIGEEGGGEVQNPPPGKMTTLAIGEEGGDCEDYNPEVNTTAIGEEGGDCHPSGGPTE